MLALLIIIVGLLLIAGGILPGFIPLTVGVVVGVVCVLVGAALYAPRGRL